MIDFSFKKSYLNIEGRSREQYVDHPVCLKLLLACTIDKFWGFFTNAKILACNICCFGICDKFICLIIYERQSTRMRLF